MTAHEDLNAIYTFTKLALGEEDFRNLVFMNCPEGEMKWDCKELEKFCTKPLNMVMEMVIEKSSAGVHDGATAIFDKLYMQAYENEKKSWFSDHASLNRCFNRWLMPPIWIRNLSQMERNKPQNGQCKYYIDDGCTRSLVYAMRLKCSEELRYKPVPAIHVTSWDFMEPYLGFKPQVAKALEHNGIFQHDNTSETEVKGQIVWNGKTNEYCGLTPD